MYNWMSKIAIALGFLAATAVGILGGIDAALMFPAIKLTIGLIIGSSSCFVNAVSYFYVVNKKDSNNDSTNDRHIIHKNDIKSSIFAIAAMLFIGITFVANFIGMYIGFTVLGGKLHLDWPRATLIIPGIFFGVCSAVSGLYFNIKVAHNLWNIIRQQPSNTASDSEQSLLINRGHSINHVSSYNAISKNTLTINDQNNAGNILPIQNGNESRLSRGIERGPTLFTSRNFITIPPVAIPNVIYKTTHEKANSL